MTETTRHDRIFLQVCDDDDSEWCGEVTWCAERIHPEDVKYIRADLVEQQLAASQKREVMLRDRLQDALWGETWWRVEAEKALAATTDLKDVILCHAEPAAIVYRDYGGNGAILQTELADDEPLYRAWEPK